VEGRRPQGRRARAHHGAGSTTSPPAATSGRERYDRDLADVFAVQDEITEAIVAAIEPQLYAAEISAPSAAAGKLDAWEPRHAGRCRTTGG